MSHQNQLKNAKYKNWVKGGLSFKYFRNGIRSFSDELVKQEHSRIFSTVVNAPPGNVCNSCNLKTLKPKHMSQKNTGTVTSMHFVCPWKQKNCNCLQKNKKIIRCPDGICDAIAEEILNCHASSPPAPNWKNTDITKWGSSPWEIAKCFISASGYLEISEVDDVDPTGFLHLFINNKRLQSHLNCFITGSDVFHTRCGADKDNQLNDDKFTPGILPNYINAESRQYRNSLFHSPSLEFGEKELHACIDGIIEILEDCKELRGKLDSKEAVMNLKQLKQDDFHIPTRIEAEVCKESMETVIARSKHLEEIAKDVKERIENWKLGDSDSMRHEFGNEQETGDIQDQYEETVKSYSRSSDLESRIAQIEIEMKQRLTDIEKEVSEINDVHSLRKRQLKYVTQKKALQEKLIVEYRKHYVNTSVSPMNVQENIIEINDVYIWPKIFSEDISSIRSNKAPKTQPIQQLQDIFFNKGQEKKRIYIVGEIGTGKSSFCQMLIHTWCNDIEDVAGILGSSKSGENTDQTKYTSDTENEAGENNDDVRLSKQFEFLFYISLRYMSGKCDDVYQMIMLFLQDIAPREMHVVGELFEKEPDNCLIILDGLDEWNPPETKECHSPHITFEIPNSKKVGNATILTMSRPSARGIINMLSSECDLKIRLTGIDEHSVKTFSRKYMLKLMSSQSLEKFYKTIRQRKMQHLEKSPLLLKQMLWMYCKGYELGNSTCDTYSSLINIMFAWLSGKEVQGTTAIPEIPISNILEQLHLPQHLGKFPRCVTNRNTIFLLSKVAFDTLSPCQSGYTFGRWTLRQTGLTENGISNILKFGLLLEEKSLNPVYEDTQFLFTHLSYHEFFAAIYIASQQNPSTLQFNEGKGEARNMGLDRLFNDIKSTIGVLQFANVLTMACGLAPTLMSQVSDYIYDVVQVDRSMKLYREELKYHNVHIDTDIPLQLQQLLATCFSQCKLDDSPKFEMIKVSDLSIWKEMDIVFLQNIDIDFLCTLFIFSFPFRKEMSNMISRLKGTLLLTPGTFTLTHALCVSIIYDLLQAVSLKRLVLWDIRCPSCTCNSSGHTIEMSRYKNLQNIELQNCLFLSISGVIYSRIESVTIIGCVLSDGQCELLSQTLNQATSLNRLVLEKITCNLIVIDLSRHDMLEEFVLCDCRNLYITYVATEALTSLTIRECDLPHEQCTTLSSSLTEAMTLRVLRIENVKCDRDQCSAHIIDLSKHEQLRILELVSIDKSSVTISGINTDRLKRFQLWSTRSVDLNIIKGALKLKAITLCFFGSNKKYTENMNSIIMSCHTLKKLGLKMVEIEECALSVSNEIQGLTEIVLKEVSMTVNSWKHFVCSILTLHQDVLVSTKDLRLTEGELSTALDYLIGYTQRLEVKYQKENELSFVTKGVGKGQSIRDGVV